MISPAIAGNDSRCGIAQCVFLGKLSAISSQYPYLLANFRKNGVMTTSILKLPKNGMSRSLRSERLLP
jgi:hypothetical protein